MASTKSLCDTHSSLSLDEVSSNSEDDVEDDTAEPFRRVSGGCVHDLLPSDRSSPLVRRTCLADTTLDIEEEEERTMNTGDDDAEFFAATDSSCSDGDHDSNPDTEDELPSQDQHTSPSLNSVSSSPASSNTSHMSDLMLRLTGFDDQRFDLDMFVKSVDQERADEVCLYFFNRSSLFSRLFLHNSLLTRIFLP